MCEAKISGTGYYVPQKKVTNFDLEKILDTSDEWIRTRTGIEERRFAEKGEEASDLATKAAKKAIENANIDKNEIDLIILATITGDYIFPATACVVQEKLGIKDIPAYDISAACSGFLYGLTTARAMIKSKMYKKILLIGVEKFSSTLDFEDRNIAVLFADGAGAVIVEESENEDDGKILSTYMGADGAGAGMLCQKGGGSADFFNKEMLDSKRHFMYMAGKEVYKNALIKMPLALQNVMEDAGLTADEIDYVIFHQANIRIIQSVAKKYNWAQEKLIINIQKYGNTSAATIPIALAEAIENGKIKKGDTVAMSAFGGGLTWSGAIIRI